MKKVFILALVLVVCLIWSAFPALAQKKMADEGTVQWEESEWVEVDSITKVSDQAQNLSAPTKEMLDSQQFGLESTHRYPEPPAEALSMTDGPMLDAFDYEESFTSDEYPPQNPEPLSGSWKQVFTHNFTTTELPSRSNVAEPSVAFAQMKKGFYTINWSAAKSADHGQTWSYVNPYANGLPSGGYTFCCDQEVVFDPVNNIHIWMRLGLQGSGGALMLSVSRNLNTWWHYRMESSTTAVPDFPHMQLTHNYLYITYNRFAPGWTNNKVMRIPLINLSRATGFGGRFFEVNDWFNMQIAKNFSYNHTMYAVSNWPTSGIPNRVKVWDWNEHSNSVGYRTITVAGWGYGGGLNCPCTQAPASGDPCARADSRVIGAAVSFNTKFPETDKNQLWVAWSSDAHGGFTLPYTYMAQISTNTWTVLDYDPIYSSSGAFIYPRLSPNGAGDIGFVSDYVGNTVETNFVAMILDGDLQDYDAGYTLHPIASGDRCPTDNKWGDYNDINPWWRNSLQFVASGHVRNSTIGSAPVYVRFTNSNNFP